MFEDAVIKNIKVMARNRIARHHMHQRYSATFKEIVRNIDRHGRRYDLDTWLALYNFKVMTERPEAALEFIRGYGELIPLKSLLAIEERYFALTESDHLFEKRLLEVIKAGRNVPHIRTTLVSFYMRTGQLPQAIEVLRALVGNAKGHALTLLRHSLLLGCWDEARAFIEDCDPQRPLVKKAQLEIQAASRRVPGPLPAGHCFINLPRSQGRRKGIQARWQALGIEPQFVDAVDGFTMPAAEYRLWCPTRRREPGSVANGLSHHGAWRRLLESSEPYAFVFEDDAWPFADLAIAAEIPAIMENSKTDLLFVNERVCYRWWQMEPHGFSPLLSSILRANEDPLRMGTDGYLVTRAGAQKLIENYKLDRVIGPTDGQMVLYSLSPEELANLPEGYMKTALSRHAAVRKSRHVVSAAVLNLPLVTQATRISTVDASYALATES